MEQIVIFDSFQQEKTNRVSATTTLPYNRFEEFKVDITGTSENLQYNFVGKNASGSTVVDLYWYNSGTVIQIPYNADLASWTLWVRKSNNSSISPSDVTSCTATCVIPWTMGDDGIPTNDRFIESVDKAITQPYPEGMWRIRSDKLFPWNNLFLDEVDKAIAEPYPKGVWRVTDTGILTQELLTEKIDFGAFANAHNLRQVSIPKSCKKIGRYAFRNTQLSSVTIARDCVYYNTSFPEGCVVNFYPD